MYRRFCLLLALIFSCLPACLTAEELSNFDIEVGIDDTFKIGCWTQVAVTADLSAGSSYLAEVETVDADGNLARFRSDGKKADANGAWTAAVPIRVNRYGSGLHVRIYLADNKDPSAVEEVVGSQEIPTSELTGLSQHDPWLLAIGQVDGVEVTSEFVDRLHVTRIESLEQLPANALCLSGIDAIILAQDESQDVGHQSLVSWITSGGRLTIFPNQPAEQFLSAPLVQQIPLKFDQTAQIRDLSRMESFVGEATRLRLSGVMTIPRIVSKNRQILVGGLSAPLIVNAPWGWGRVTVCTLNLNDEALQTWEALPQLYRLLSEFPGYDEQQQQSSSNQLTQAGISDLKTQWDAGLEQFNQFTPSVWIPLSLLLAVALIVGPIDYFLVRHVFKQPGLTWFTLPALILVCVVWGISSANRQIDPQVANETEQVVADVHLNQALVIDFAEETGTARFHQFQKFQVNETGRYDLQARVHLPISLTETYQLTSPSFVPESTYRGYYRNSNTYLDQTDYIVIPQQGQVLRSPIHEQSTMLLETQGLSQTVTNSHSAGIKSTLETRGANRLVGSITSQLDCDLSSWFIAFDKLIFFVPEDHPLAVISPGEQIDFSTDGILQRELTAFLTGTTRRLVKRRSGVGEDLLVQRRDYDLLSRDLEYIIMSISFHDLIGGQEYTQLTNVELSDWDLSRLLELEQAVLIGTCQSPATTSSAEVDAEELHLNQQVSFLRCVMPVQKQTVDLERLPEYD